MLMFKTLVKTRLILKRVSQNKRKTKTTLNIPSLFFSARGVELVQQ